jgi:hypothetical protein
VATELVAAARILSMHRYGALVVWDPVIPVGGGTVLGAVVTRELLVAVFSPESTNKLRIGGIIIRGQRVKRAGVPLVWKDVLARAGQLAAGVAINVDENTGEIRHADQTGYVEVVDATSLARLLYRHAVAPARPR